MNIDEIVASLGNLTIPEAIALTKQLRETWGITETVHPLSVPANNLVKEIEKVVESYDLVLRNFGTQKIAVIKVVREATNIGLAEGKKLVETPDSIILKSASPEAANALLTQLKAAGATADLVESQ